MEKVVVSGVAFDRNQARISIMGVPDRPGIAGKLFGAVASQNLVVDMIVQNIGHDTKATDISFTVPKTDLRRAKKLARALADEMGARGVDVRDDITKVSIVGVGMKSHSGVAALMFETLAAKRINIMMISTSEIKISCVIEAAQTRLAVRALHEAFGLSSKTAARKVARKRKATARKKAAVKKTAAKKPARKTAASKKS